MNPRERKRKLWILTGAALLLMLSASSIGGVFWLRNRAVEENTQLHKPWQAPAPELVKSVNAEKLEKAKFLREKWRVAWAEKHKPELRAMLGASPNDQAALDAVVEAIPNLATRDTAGFDSHDLGASSNFSDPHVVAASWTVRHAKLANPDDPVLAKHLAESQRMIRARTQEDFASQRDVVISQIGGISSDDDLFLWASGRITKQSIVPQKVPTNSGNKPKFVWPVHQQIVPPYDFLQSQNQQEKIQ